VERWKTYDRENKELDAKIEFESDDTITKFHIYSRGGTKSSSDARNQDYNQALESLFGEKKKQGAIIEDIIVNSSTLIDLQPKDKRVFPNNYSYPIRLKEVKEVAALRKAIAKSVSLIGKRPGAKGGNPTKRLLITFSDKINESERFNDFQEITESFQNRKFTSSGPPPSGIVGTFSKDIDKPGYVYVFVLEGIDKNVLKVGYTSDLKKRLKKLNKEILTSLTKLKWSPYTFWRRDSLRSAYDLEQSLHRELKSYLIEKQREIYGLSAEEFESLIVNLKL
tara:strand:+ start:247 stop:1086 length:840 start_codon:yes stop_codon:yes gene_type:complete